MSAPHEPHEFGRRVLAMAVGLTPQVVTETLYALVKQRNPAFIPTEIQLLTTTEGARRARLTLLDPAIGQFHSLCADYGLTGQVKFDDACIHTISTARGPLQDIRTPGENALAADAITTFVRGLCADPLAAVHLSIAGGRKSMGYYLGYALSLFGREQDRLSHVLVSEPFETHHEFFFPPRTPKVLFGRDNQPVSTADARIDLADIPFVRLRSGLPEALLQGSASFSATVSAATQRLTPATLVFDLPGGGVRAAGALAPLPPQLLAWYATLAESVITASGEQGFVRYTDLVPARLLHWYGEIAGRMNAGYIQLETQLRRDGGIAEEFFRQKNAKLNARLREALGVEAAPFLVARRGTRPYTRCGLLLAPGRIEGLPDMG